MRKEGLNASRTAVYTCLTGGYETLNELKLDRERDVDYLCFTDDPTLVSSTWEVVPFARALAGDPFRSQRVIKIAGHPRLAHYSETLYVDNTVELLRPASEIVAEWLDGSDFTLITHGFRETVADEFHAVLEANLDQSDRVLEQLEHYQEHYPAVLREKPFWNGMMARRTSPTNSAIATTWLQQVLRYARRDQLSFNVACAINHAGVRRLDLDLMESDSHRWPIETNRNEKMRVARPTDQQQAYADLTVRYEQANEVMQRLSDEVAALESHLAAAKRGRSRARAQLAEVKNSRSWRLTEPIRRLADRRR